MPWVDRYAFHAGSRHHRRNAHGSAEKDVLAQRLVAFPGPLALFAQSKGVVAPPLGDEPSHSVGDAMPGDIGSGKKAWVKGFAVTGTMPDIGQQNITPGTSPQTISRGYHDGTGQVAGDTELITGNIRSGVTIFGVPGTALEASGDAEAEHVLAGRTFRAMAR